MPRLRVARLGIGPVTRGALKPLSEMKKCGTSNIDNLVQNFAKKVMRSGEVLIAMAKVFNVSDQQGK